jgi:hypothetical protein
MAICETCGTKYAPTRESPECPRCASGEAAPAGRPAKVARTPRAPASTASARPARAATRPPAQQPAQAPERELASRHLEPEGVLDQSAKIGLMASGGLAIIVLLVVFFVMRKKADEREALTAYENEVKELYQQMSKLDVAQEADARRLIQTAKDREGRWKDHELAPQIQTLIVRAAASLESGKERREALTAFTDIENQLADPSKLTPEAIGDLRRRLAELEAKITMEGDEYLKRYTAARVGADKAYVNGLVAVAQTLAQESPSNPRPALQKMQTAEDEARKALDQAYLEKDTELQEYYADLYRKVIAESDKLATALFTDKTNEALPWVDYLSDEKAKLPPEQGGWNATTVRGFSAVPENGVLQIVGPDADAGQIAIVAIGDKEAWRNFELDIEFTIEKGNMDVFFRMGRTANANTVNFPLMSEGDNKNLVAGRKYQARMRMLGSRITVKFADEDIDTPPPKDEQVTWAKTRKGAIAFLVPPGARVKVTKFQVRELR